MTIALALAATFSGTAHVVDGDTLRVGRERIRIQGVDAPELSQLCGSGRDRWPCGRGAAAFLRRHVEGRALACERRDTDRFGRVVAICRLRGSDVGRLLVEAGWATAYRRYSLTYVASEERARKAARGIWRGRFQSPSAYRRERMARAGTPPPDPSCPIKGNIGSAGARIYHRPGDRDYAAVRVDLGRGERWFCSVGEAHAAGWRAARR